MDHDLEQSTRLQLDWSKVSRCVDSVVPVCVQDADTKEVLIVASANEQAVNETRRRRICVLWSTSRHKLWIKGETSGDYLDLVDIKVNCEQNSLLYLVRPRQTGACHTRDHRGNTRPSCYYRALVEDPDRDELVFTPRPSLSPFAKHLVVAAATCALTALIMTRTRRL